jgi:PAS domain S-box-containing protein
MSFPAFSSRGGGGGSSEIEQLQAEIQRLMQLEDEHAQTIHLLDLVVNNVADLIAIISPDGGRIWNNPAYATVLGYTPAEMANTESLEQIHPDDIPLVQQTFEQSMKTGFGRDLEYRMRHKDGSWVFLESRATVVKDETGTPSQLVLVARDITMRKAIEKQNQIETQKPESGLSPQAVEDLRRHMQAVLKGISGIRHVTESNWTATQKVMEAEKIGQQMALLLERVLRGGGELPPGTQADIIRKTGRVPIPTLAGGLAGGIAKAKTGLIPPSPITGSVPTVIKKKSDPNITLSAFNLPATVKHRILFMDDDALVQTFITSMLENEGYTVAVTADGAQAINAFAKAKLSGSPFDLVILDLVVPGRIGGQEAAHTLRKMDPAVKILASTANLAHPVMIDPLSYGFDGTLPKPYNGDQLLDMMREVFAESTWHKT